MPGLGTRKPARWTVASSTFWVERGPSLISDLGQAKFKNAAKSKIPTFDQYQRLKIKGLFIFSLMTSPLPRSLSLQACMFVLALSQALADPSPRTATITFSGVYNGAFPWSDSHGPHRPMPSNYQPLLATQSRTQPVDGGALDVTITWLEACVSNHGYNGQVVDHTGDYQASGSGGGVLFSPRPFSMIFSKPVELPSLFWTYYIPTSYTGVITVFRRATDQIPLKTVQVHYPDSHGYAWHELTEFRGLEIEKITFNPGDPTGATGLNIDDIKVELPSDRKP